MSVGILGRFVKQSGETLDYNVDFSEWMAGRNDAAASFTVTVDAGITLVASERTGNVVSVVLSGGTSGQQYKVTVRLTTNASNPITKEADFLVKVKDV
jgi:hypothetical protein